MGLIKAISGAAGGTLADQWKEFFYCEALDKNTLMRKGQKQTSRRSSNTRGNDNIISNGSGIAVADGQCMIIVEQGKVVEFCAEPGEFTYDTSSEPSLFTGELGKGILDTFKTIGRRFTYGADTGKDQRVYYFNLKELMDNKFGTPNPIPFRIVDRNANFDIDLSVRCSGVYSFKITDPLLFYTNVCGNVTEEFTRDEIENQLKTEFISSLQQAFAKISALQIRPSELPAHAEELTEAMNEALTQKWSKTRGLSVVSVALNPITLSEEDAELLKEAQRKAIYKNATMAGAAIVDAQAEAMMTAAGNPNGAMMGFMGLGMAQQAGGIDAQSMYAMGQAQEKMAQEKMAQQAGGTNAQSKAVSEWVCSCGTANTGKFCMECGKPKPADSTWVCSCGTANTGKFCTECGKPKP